MSSGTCVTMAALFGRHNGPPVARGLTRRRAAPPIDRSQTVSGEGAVSGGAAELVPRYRARSYSSVSAGGPPRAGAGSGDLVITVWHRMTFQTVALCLVWFDSCGRLVGTLHHNAMIN